MKPPAHILVFRFSALGDVAMTVPVIRTLLQQNPRLRVTMVSTAFVKPLFAGIDRLDFHAADLKGSHKGFIGLYRLFRQLKKQYKATAVADLHDVLRTKILRQFFRLSGIPVAVVDKGRKEKAELTRIEHKKLQPLLSTFERYAAVFRRLGLSIQLPAEGSYVRMPAIAGRKKLGIAPFAKHAEKRYPLDRMKEVLRMLAADGDTDIYLFGSREEAPLLEEWERDIKGLTSLAGKMNFAEELEHISTLHLMVSMDSANMHLASLFGVPVVSVWGATHPFAGFYGWGQDPKNTVQVALYCRPCSVFGNKPCYRGDLACMQAISAQMVYDRIVQAFARG